MRSIVRATKRLPHPELVEGRRTVLQLVGWATEKTLHEDGAVRGCVAHLVASAAQRPHHLDHSGGGIEADAVADAAVAVGVVGEDDGDAALRRRCRAQARPGGGELRDEGDAVGQWTL